MKKIDMIVKAPHFYTMEGEGVGYKTGVAMLVDGGKIIGFADEKELADYSAEKVLNLVHHAVLPGFIDGHMHTACAIMRGLAQDTNNWMMYSLGSMNFIIRRLTLIIIWVNSFAVCLTRLQHISWP